MSAVGNRFDNETGETRSKAGGQARIFTAFWICKKRVSASYSRQLYMLTEDDSSENTRWIFRLAAPHVSVTWIRMKKNTWLHWSTISSTLSTSRILPLHSNIYIPQKKAAMIIANWKNWAVKIQVQVVIRVNHIDAMRRLSFFKSDRYSNKLSTTFKHPSKTSIRKEITPRNPSYRKSQSPNVPM